MTQSYFDEVIKKVENKRVFSEHDLDALVSLHDKRENAEAIIVADKIDPIIKEARKDGLDALRIADDNDGHECAKLSGKPFHILRVSAQNGLKEARLTKQYNTREA